MNFSIRKRIWSSFLVLISIFVINGIVTIIILNNSKNLSQHISTVIDPVQQCLQDFRTIIVESKMYTTNWVFLRSNEQDKNALRNLHQNEYPKVREKLMVLLPQMDDKRIMDSIGHVFENFEQLIEIEKQIMFNLAKFEDYDDLIKKMVSEQIVEDQVLPQTSYILNELNHVASLAKKVKVEQYNNLENYSVALRVLITLLAIFIIGLGIFLSLYFTKIITLPIRKIKEIIADLGKGIINKVDYAENKDEIGEMVSSVNHLSEKLQETAKFAQEVGNRNFTLPFSPLSDHDVLGKALLTMRKNIKTSEENLLKTSSNLIKRNQALEQYTFIVSHNLRAPVATILGLAELLNNGNIPHEDIKDILAGIQTSSQKLDNVIHDLNHILEIKQQAHEIMEKVSLPELVDEIKLTFNKLISESNIEFNCQFKDAEHVTTVKSYLLSIIYNLISNSIKYKRPDVPLLIEISCYKEQKKIIIQYKDNGKGIDMQKNAKKLFGLYERFDLSVEGKGMGLFMIKTQVEHLDGTISVESEINKGTKFKIELPEANRLN